MINTYTSTDLRRTVAALFCTIVFSATCIIGAVAPAAVPAAPMHSLIA